MKIIIAGAGEVGTHLAKMFSGENQDIILMDMHEDRLKVMESNFDLMTIKGNPISLTDLRTAGVASSDLFIAVTPEESKNMTACMLASNMGARTTLARIDNYEYLLSKNREFFQKLGVDALIYPEMLAAKEIVNSLKRIWVRTWLDFYGGSLILIGTKIRANAPILNQRFDTIFASERQMRVVAIKRDTETIIPKGSEYVREGDLIYVMSTRDRIPYLRELAGKDEQPIRNVMIMGGSRICQKTCQYLPDSIKVKVIEQNKERAYDLLETLPNVMVINGDGRNTDLLREEGIRNMDAFVAVTGNSEANILACLAAQRAGVRKTIAEIENIDYIPLAQRLDIGTVINKKLIAASHIYQYTLDVSVSDIKCLTNVDVDIVEFTARADSRMTRSQVKNLRLPRELNIGGYIRDGEGYIVTGDTQLQEGDHVIVFCYSSKTRQIEKYFD